ncbi:hypothetical protein ACHAXS_004213 [Conticribra weissflogii]
MGKRPKPSKSKALFTLNKFDDVNEDDDDDANDVSNHDLGSTSEKSGHNDGGGMSRAAKKRAKKRAKKEIAVQAQRPAVDKANGKNHDGAINGGAKGTKNKMQLPLDDGFSDAEDREGEGDDLLTQANKKQKKIKEGKKKDKEKKKEKDAKDADAKDGVEKVSKKNIAKKVSEEDEDDDDDDVNNAEFHEEEELEPEVEELLSSLTPLQIMMLDENKAQPESAEMDATTIGDSKPGANAEESDDTADEGETENVALAENMLEGEVDPLLIVKDLTTEHRAKVLLASLISPSGVTVHEFYSRYWGKRPLLAALDNGSGINVDDDDDQDSNAKSKMEVPTEEDPYKDKLEKEAIQHATRLDGLLNRSIIHQMIRRNKLRYGLDLNVTQYTDALGNGLKHRITLDPPPKKRKHRSSTPDRDDDDDDNLEYAIANPQDIWSNVDTSHCTLRLLRPHEHNDSIHTMLSLLESEFGCMVGSNAYLTPLHSQGFAPHYDDVDVFILQLEGYKRWRVYAPPNKMETLPRESSRDYTEKEVEEDMGCELIMDLVIGPGDVLYLPRGWIHQAETVARPAHMVKVPSSGSGGKGKTSGYNDSDAEGPGGHSLHLTVSAMQNWSWADFLEILLPEALEAAAASDKNISLREGLPRNFLSYMGTMHQLDDEDNGPEGLKQALEAVAKASNDEDGDIDEAVLAEVEVKQRIRARQNYFKNEAKKRIMRVCKQAMSMLDDACDQIGKRFLSDRLPPALLEPELSLTKEASPLSSSASKTLGHPHHDPTKKIWPNTLCRLVRPNIARLVIEDSKVVLYHCLDNSRVYHGTPLSPMEFEIDDAPALEQLLTTVEPHWIMVKDLIHGDVEDKMEIAQALYDEGILATMLADAPDRSVQTG